MAIFQPELTWINDALHSNCKLEVQDGLIKSITFDGNCTDKGLFLPGFVNAHSHAFQRGLRGRGEKFTAGSNSFWVWRDEMYRLVNELTVDSMRSWCTLAFKEMRDAGITTVGEFHYLHHLSNLDYAFDQVVLEAAHEAGIRIVLLQAAYMHGSIGNPLVKEQSRFDTSSIKEWLYQLDALKNNCLTDLQSIGAVAHSIRAVDIESISTIATQAFHRRMPLHLHVEEQRQEIEASLSAYGKTPLALLNDSIEVSPLVTAVHCTHSSAADLEEWISKGGNVCICPLTEANLADGICDIHRIVNNSGCICIGTDSNARISMVEEMRLLEYAQRLSRESRGICVDSSGDMGAALMSFATKSGARALGIPAGAIEVGKYADFTVINLQHRQIQGVRQEELISAICCGADNGVIERTIVAGI